MVRLDMQVTMVAVALGAAVLGTLCFILLDADLGAILCFLATLGIEWILVHNLEDLRDLVSKVEAAKREMVKSRVEAIPEKDIAPLPYQADEGSLLE